MTKENELLDITNELEHLAKRTFSIIELVEVANVSDKSFKKIRTKLLNLGNDILRLENKKSW